jgi:DNA-damage-inducible protein J
MINSSKIEEEAMQEATMNVRMPLELKQQGDEVLQREKVSVSQAVRGLYEYLRTEQQLPLFLQKEKEDEKARLIKKRQALMREMVGIVPPDIDLGAIKEARLARQIQAGVQE